MADLSESVFNAPVIMWAGLGSGVTDRYWEPLHEMQKRISGAALIKSQSGYQHWQDVAEHIKETGQRKVLIGHSNGAYAITKVADSINSRGIPCDLIVLDRTLKSCPKIGTNVMRVCEIWFGLARVNFVKQWNGEYHYFDYHSESHVGGLSNEGVQNTVVKFANTWA